MRKFLKLLLCSVLVFSLACAICGCNKETGPKDYEFTTERPTKTLMPTVTYGCDLYTADLPSLKKMGGVVYRGDAFGEIPDEETAVKAAVQAVYEIYGNAFDGYTPVVCSYNKRADCWIVHGTPRDNRNTGMTFVAIRKNTGEVVMLRKNPKDD